MSTGAALGTFIGTITAILIFLGIRFVVEDRGWEIEAGMCATFVGGVTCGCSLATGATAAGGAGLMSVAAIASAPFIPLVAGAAATGLGIAWIGKGLYNTYHGIAPPRAIPILVTLLGP